MSRFALLQNAEAAPTHCRFCGEYAGPFIDTGCEEVNYGRIWVCAPIEGHRGGCVGSMAAACGWHTPGEYAAQQQIIANLQDEIEALNGRTYEISLGELVRASGSAQVTKAYGATVVLDRVLEETAVVEEPPNPDPLPPDPEDMTKDALIALARARGIKPANKAMTKGELEAALAAKEA